MRGNPRENLLAGCQVIGSGHGVPGCVPEVGSRHDLRQGEIQHGLAGADFLVAIPGVVQDPRGLALSKCAE